MEKHEKCTDIAVLKESLKVANNRIKDLEDKNIILEAKIDSLENTTVKLETILERLEKAVDLLSKSLDKAKWYLITGILGPILLAVVLAYFK